MERSIPITLAVLLVPGSLLLLMLFQLNPSQAVAEGSSSVQAPAAKGSGDGMGDGGQDAADIAGPPEDSGGGATGGGEGISTEALQSGAAGGGDEVGRAQAPIVDAATSKISFQALLTDNSGIPLAGPTVNLEFNIYNGGGVVVEGPINMAGVSIDNGVVDVQVPVTNSSFDGSERLLGVKVNGGAELVPRTALTSVPHAFRVDRVASEELDDDIELGNASTDGHLGLWDAGSGFETMQLMGGSARISTYGSDGLEKIRLWGLGYGEVRLHDQTDNNQTVQISANCGAAAVPAFPTICITETGGSIALRDAGGGAGIFAAGGSGTLACYQADGGLGVFLDGEDGGAGSVSVRDTGGSVRVNLDGSSVGTGGEISVYDNDGTETVQILGAEASTTGPEIRLRDSAGTTTIELDGEVGTLGGGYIGLRKSDGTTTITFDSDVSGDGRVTTQELRITGGSDLSEQFDVQSATGEVKPGMVVSINPDKPGQLVVSTRAYDRTVAGVISGAGGLEPGMMMGQEGSVANGEHPVALTGRIYCMADATSSAIRPGDLLTTSDTPGHAMKVTDHMKAHGAILGKAMTALEKGKGLVLVLVALH